ncbi:DUF4097 family beta strand repeat-containing protein [Clostridium sp. E02]|uniref:DUF4097 family beta strand repeat-containing protein n=1 Tax=Clostridium sp. E02 TaxID=2487134 RepID=UPI000F52E6DF|nr:DUF4097 family beta strand repeat-containing protein [Clostridium sp. E02]
MNRFIKVSLIIGGICILTGGIMAVIASTLGGNLFELDPILDIKQEITEFTDNGVWHGEIPDYYDELESNHVREEDMDLIYSSPDLKSIVIENLAGTVLWKEVSGQNGIQIYSNKDSEYWELKQNERELELTVTGSKKKHKNNDLVVTIQVPEDYRLSKVDLMVSRRRGGDKINNSSPLILARTISADELNLDVKVGAVKLEDADTNSLSIETSVGAVEFTGNVSKEVTAECKVGAIKLNLNGDKDDFNYEVESKVGAIRIEDENYAGLVSKARLNNGAHKEMDLECNTGAIEVNFNHE